MFDSKMPQIDWDEPGTDHYDRTRLRVIKEWEEDLKAGELFEKYPREKPDELVFHLKEAQKWRDNLPAARRRLLESK